MISTNQSLRGRTALVTGATSGIGRAAANQLAREGAEVIVHGRDPQRGKEVVAEIVQARGQARFIAADLSDPTERPPPRRRGRRGRCAGQQRRLVLVRAHRRPRRRHLRRAVRQQRPRAPTSSSRRSRPRWRPTAAAASSTSPAWPANIGIAGAAAYGGTKATLAAMTRSWAAEFSPRGVRVNAVAPGPVYTAADPTRTESLGATTLLGRAAQADEIAEVITFLASPPQPTSPAPAFAADGGRTAV